MDNGFRPSRDSDVPLNFLLPPPELPERTNSPPPFLWLLHITNAGSGRLPLPNSQEPFLHGLIQIINCLNEG
jgi:hypothetical protein